uniref:Transmembrane protein 147 n=1 Tax=Schistocephalus solidus TaxID=70667 RepID=A0A0X3Q4F6_SCHSO
MCASTESDIWEESEVQGFSFDDVDSANTTLYNESLTPNFRGETADSPFILIYTNANCAFCKQKLPTVVKYERDTAFCSEECWTKSLRTCVADLRSGGISSWPVEMFVSLDAKRKLLELASETFDGDFLLQVVLLVKSRLDREIFFQVLLENELSYQQYVRFLNETGQITDATALYEAKGCVQDSKIYSFKGFLVSDYPVTRQECEKHIHTLRIFAVTELSSNPNLRAMHASTLQAVDLLEFQTQVNSEWLDFVQKTLPSASEHVKSLLGEISGPLIGQNLASTMVACILMDNKATNGSRAYQLKDKHKMPDEVFRWLALEPLIALQHWMEIDSLLMEKKWFARKCVIGLPVDRLILFLHSKNSPKAVIARYLQYLPDSDTLVDLVVRLGLYGLGIENFVRKKDAAGLRSLHSRVPTSGSNEIQEIEAYLSLPTNQWKEYIPKE